MPEPPGTQSGTLSVEVERRPAVTRSTDESGNVTKKIEGIQAGSLAIELEPLPPSLTRPIEKVYAFWLAGMSCDGCTISVSGCSDPSLEDLLLGTVPGLPRVILYHPVLNAEAGEEFVHNFELAAQGKLDAPYVVILEGSAVDDSLIDGPGYWVGLGAHPAKPGEDGGTVISVMEWIDRMAPGAAAAIAIGTCATWGGIPSAAGNPTGAMGLMDYLGKDYRSAFGLPCHQHPRLRSGRRQLQRSRGHGAALPSGNRAASGVRRARTARVAVRSHGPRALRPGRLLRGRRFREEVRRPGVPGGARVLGTDRAVQYR